MMLFTRIPITLAGLFCLLTISLHSQTVLFQPSYGIINYDFLETADSYLIAGETLDDAQTYSDALLIRMDKTGNVLWKKTYGQFDNDGFMKVMPANDSGFIAWGYTKNFNYKTDDAWLVKLDGDGNILWQKTMGQSGYNEFPTGNIIVMPDGYILSGLRVKPGYSQTFVTRVNNNGETMWSRLTPSMDYNNLQAQYVADDVLYLAGNINRLGCWRSMNAKTGSVILSREYLVDTTHWVYQAHPTPDGNHLLTGAIAKDNMTTLPDMGGWVQKVDPQSNVLWSKFYRLGKGSSINASDMLADGSCILSVYYKPVFNPSLLHTALVKIDPDGAVVWARDFGSDFTVLANRISKTTDGGLMAVGNISRTIAGIPNWDSFWMKTDSLGIVDGCCVKNVEVNIEDVSPVLMAITINATSFDTMAPFDWATADTATLNLRDFCFNESPVVSRTVSFCPGESVTLGDSTYNVPGVYTVLLPSTTGDCDTIATYTLELLPQPTFSQTITFCANEPVTLGDSTYSQSAIVGILLPSTTDGCDTLAVYTLEMLPQPVSNQTITFCPGETVTIRGNTYTQPGTVQLTLPSTTGGCDTLATYTLELLPQPTFSQTIAFCPNETVTIHGVQYDQPGTFQRILPSTTGGCDTLATYTLEYKTLNQPNTLQLTCPANVSVTVPSGATGTTVSYAAPVVSSNCPCPDLLINQTSGAPSGTTFTLGVHSVCYRADDACGYSKTCCFTVRVEEESTCDEKTNGCVQFELLTIQRDAGQNWVYRVRVTNNCTAEMTYAYLQVPNGLQAIAPANNSPYTAQSGAVYNVRNPNYSPFYSVRYDPVAAGIVGGQSEVFRYVLPAQADLDYLHTAIRLASGALVEAHLNTFNCPVGNESASSITERSARVFPVTLQVIPNPAAAGSTLFITGNTVPDGVFVLQDVMGRVVAERQIVDNQVILGENGFAPGVYFFKIRSNGVFVGSGKISLF